MTRRLDREDPYRVQFEATVVEQVAWEGRPAVILDATCFYPTSGGQPHDTGTLGDIPVLDVVEWGEYIVHVVAQPLPLGPVCGVIDWERRFDHMQQHTGQHILSQAFEHVLDAATLSFHLGDVASTIDVAVSAPDAAAFDRVEALANRVVLENRAVTVCEYGEDAIDALPLRKAPAVRGRIRVVMVEGFDASACGGTHVRATGEVGVIRLSRWERHRGGIRVEFRCGWRALRDYRLKDAICQSLAAQFSVGVSDLPEAVARLVEAEQEVRRQAEGLRRQLLESELSRLVAEAEPLDTMRVVCRLLDGYDAGNMRYLAQRLTQQSRMVALLAVRDPSPQLCFARAEDVSVDMGALLREATTPFGGRGGGKPHLAQGGGVAQEALEAVLAFAREQLRLRQG